MLATFSCSRSYSNKLVLFFVSRRFFWRQSIVQEESAVVIVSAQGRNGAFVVFCGEEGLEEEMLVLSVVLFAVIITLRGLAAAVVEVMAVGRGATVFMDD